MSVHSQAAPPQDARVRLTYTTKEEAGRFAVARRDLLPGELVLAAAPYGLVMNPKLCPSALYLSSRCSAVGDDSSTAGISVSGEGGDTASASHTTTRAAKTGKPAKKNASKHGSKGEPTAEGASAATAAQFVSPYRDALYGASGDGEADEATSSAASSRWYTTQSTWCAACFQEVPAGRWLCNRGSLAELAVDMSWEQAQLEAQVAALAAEAACSQGEKTGAGGALIDSDADDGDDAGRSATNAAAFRKLKKPTKSTKMRKNGAVELKRKLLEKALAQREEILYERQLQRRSRVARGCPVVRLEGWEASSFSGDAVLSSPMSAISGCSGCGVLCYCSESCWRTHHRLHVESGECAVLRGLYPRLMSEYFSAGVSGASAASGQPAVVLPGDEPLHWARSTSEAKTLEFQSLLFSALALARAARSGYASHFDETAPSTAAVPAAVSSPSTNEGSDAGAAAGENVSAKAAAEPSSSKPSLPSTNTVDSVILPKEVATIHEMRSKAGLTGTVEVLDADPALRRTAREGDGQTSQMECVPRAARVENGPTATSNKLDPSREDSTAAASGTARLEMYVRQPRYADMAQMETNLCVISKPRRSTYQRYYRAFAKRVLPVLQVLDLDNVKGEVLAMRPPASTPSVHVSESYFLRLCAAAQCNSFGVYDTQDSCVAFGMYPEASYFNHSCVPNICRVMQHGGRLAAFYALRPITAQEPLTISYTDVEQQNSAERRRNLLETYRFFCMCARCSGHAEGPVMAVGRAVSSSVSGDAHSSSTAAGAKDDCPVIAVSPLLFEKPLLLCTQCAIRGYLRPLPPAQHERAAAPSAAEAALTWGMADVSVRECTMCRCRVVREVMEERQESKKTNKQTNVLSLGSD